MINTWFTSDTHFGHQNILEYEPIARPFKCLEEMHEVMIDRWNSVVKTNDIVYHLGDFCFGRSWLPIAEKLNGNKRLVMGNHDTLPTDAYLKYFVKLYGVLFMDRCILSHVPVHANGLGDRWLLNMHGHLHSRKIMTYPPWDDIWKNTTDKFYFNVSVEQNNLTPIHRDVVWERIKKNKL